MDIASRIKKLGKFFSQMQIVQTESGGQVIYVVVNFPRNWEIDEESAKKHNVTIGEGTNVGEYYFCADIDTGEEAIFDTIDDTVDKMKDAMERAKLLNEKTIELKNIFEDESIPLEKLRTIKFSFEQSAINSIITKTKKDKKEEKEKEEES